MRHTWAQHCNRIKVRKNAMSSEEYGKKNRSRKVQLNPVYCTLPLDLAAVRAVFGLAA